MGRTLKVTVVSARDLRNADAEEGGESDPFVLICFDSKVNQELARTETVENSSEPEWNQDFEIDITSSIESTIAEQEKEPNMLTFCVYDGDEGSSEPLGVAGISFSELVKSGKFEGELPVFMGSGFITVKVALKKVKVGSMLTSDAALKIAGGVAGTAAIGALGVYLFNRYQKKKEKDSEQKTGIAYGANIDDDDDDDEDKGNMKRWWEMDDEEDDDDDENRWTAEVDADEE